MLPQPEMSQEVLAAVSDPSDSLTKQHIRKLIRQLKNPNEEAMHLLKETMTSLATILKDPNVHPKIKLGSHRMIRYLILMADLDVYEEFLHSLYGILRVNCMYNKGSMPVETRGEDFFKKSKYFTDPNATAAQKNEIKQNGIAYIQFCLETVYMLAKWLPYDLEDDTKPTKFSIAYETLKKQGVDFPKEERFQFYGNSQVEDVERVIRDIEKQYESILGSQVRTSSAGELRTMPNELPLSTHLMKQRESQIKKDNLSLHREVAMDMEGKNKMFLLEEEKKKLLKEIEIQRSFFEGELEKQRKLHQQNILKYEKKILKLEEDSQRLRGKIASLESKPPVMQSSELKTSLQSPQGSDKAKDRLIDELQNTNRQLAMKIKKLEEDIKQYQLQAAQLKQKASSQVSGGNGSVMSVEIEKLKKENKSLKAKILTECSEASEFSTKKSSTKTQNSQKEPQSLKFLGYEDAKSSFEPFYSNSSSEIKIRLRKAILRQKQLLYRDKTLQIGCITKLEGPNSVRLTTVFTNVSEKPLFNFAIDFVSRQDLVVKLLQNTKNYLQISGQTKSEILVSIGQIDFRCLLCSVRFNIEQQVQKIALIMPLSKLKLAQQLVYTPMKKQDKVKKIERVFQSDRKMLPNLHKFKDYFDQAILQVDRTLHETYNLKVEFMGSKFYVECDEIEGELRMAVKYFEDEDYSRAQKLLDELVFLLIKN